MTRHIPILAYPAAVMWIVTWWSTAQVGYHRSTEEANAWAEVIHRSFIERASRWPGDAGQLVPGLVLGNTDGITESLAEAMRVTSLTHLMAVSGSNCAIVVGLAFGVAALLKAPLFARVLVAFVTLAGFVTLVGPEPSVIRSALMAGIGLLALLWGRPAAGVTALCAAIIVALAIDPTMSHSIGFALSVTATLGLLVLGQPIATTLTRWLPSPVALALAIPLSAAIACQPIILVMSPYLPTYGIVANILAEPLVSIATVCGMLAVVLAPIPFLADGLLWIATAAAWLIAEIARTLASFPGARIPWPAGWMGVVCATTVSFGASLAVTVRWRRAGLVIAAVASVAGLSMTVGAGRIAWASAPADWSWAQCDVGQGDAVVIRSAGMVALIDTGRTEPPLRECLRTLGVDRIDLLVLTHFDIDHVGGYGVVLGSVKTVLHGPADGIADEVILDRLRENGAKLVDAERGMTGSLGQLSWRVLWPSPTTQRDPGNPSSITLLVTPGPTCDSTCVSGLDLGDLPAAEQSMLLALGGLSPVDVVKVSHHGSRDQDPDLYRRVHAIVGLIGVGAENDYGHPTADSLDMLAGTGTSVVRSDLNGISLVWRTTAGDLRVWRERATDPGFTLRAEE